MKKLIFAIAFFMSATVNADVGPQGFSNSMDAAGSVSHSEKHFIYIKNVSNGALSSGDVVVPDSSADDGVSHGTSATAGAFPSCIIAQSSCADDALCKCQTYGVGSVNFDVDNGRATAGLQAFISEGDGGKVQSQAVGSYAAGDIPIGMFLDASTSGGVAGKDPASESLEVFIRLR